MDILPVNEFVDKLYKRYNAQEITLEDVGYKILCYHKFINCIKREFNIMNYH